MKKLMVFMVLAILMSGASYAQELKFDGYLNSGMGVVSTNIKESRTLVKAFGTDSEQNGFRFRLNGSFTGEEKNAGVKFRFQSQNRLDQGGYFSLPYVYGWVKFLKDIFYAAGGIVDDGTWATGDFWLASENMCTGLGALIKATPIEGLDLGIGAYVISTQNSGGNNILNFSGNLPNFEDIRTRFGDLKYTYHASYTMPDVFRVGASFRWKNKAGYNTAIGDYNNYTARYESSQLIGEFRLLAVKDLTAVAAASFDKIEDFSNKGDMIFSETFAYKINSLTLGLNAVQFLYKRGDVKYDPSLLFNLWGSYAIDKIVPRLDLVYFLGGQSNTGRNETTYTWHRKGFTNYNTALSNNDDDDYSAISIRPSVKFNFNSKTFIEIGDMINIDLASFDGYNDTVGGPRNTDSRISNVFYIDFKWSF